MNSLPAGYKLRPDGNYEKTCIFDTSPGKCGYVETLIRSPRGELLKVLRKRDLQNRTGNYSAGTAVRPHHPAGAVALY